LKNGVNVPYLRKVKMHNNRAVYREAVVACERKPVHVFTVFRIQITVPVGSVSFFDRPDPDPSFSVRIRIRLQLKGASKLNFMFT
jgi:hypothetical protein